MIRKVKSFEELNAFEREALGRKYMTVIGPAVSLDDIDIVKKKPDHVTWGKMHEIPNSISERFSSLTVLFLEIEGLRLEDGAWFDYSESQNPDEPEFTDSKMSFYLSDDLLMDDKGYLKYPLSPIFKDLEFPIGYMFMDMDTIVKSYVSDLVKYHSDILNKNLKNKKNREDKRRSDIDTFNSIRLKLTEDEFKFLIRKMKLTNILKKQIMNGK